jgi:hypothetical protein
METVKKKTWDRKGGRPKKPVRKSEQLAVMCSLVERKIIEHKAKQSGVPVSQFLRELALNGKIETRPNTFPKEILLFTSTQNHLAANVNQVAKKRNREETFNAKERAEWMLLSEDVKKLAEKIKNCFH